MVSTAASNSASFSSSLNPFAILTSEEAAWLAGYIDGDGCITLQRNRGKSRPMLVIDSCDIELLERVMKIIGDGYLVRKTRAKEKHRQAYTYRLHSFESLQRVLTAIYPYLYCDSKKRRVSMILAEWGKLRSTTGVSLTPEQHELREQFYERFDIAGSGRGSRRRAVRG